jgi:hypothetical protein
MLGRWSCPARLARDARVQARVVASLNMKRRTFLGGSLFAAVLFGAGADGCGSGVATCESICALPGAPASVATKPLNPGGDNNVETTSVSCAAACATQETACASAGYGPDFQAYLTCVGNVGSYADVQQNVDTTNPAMPAHYTTTVVAACAAEAAALANECGSSPGAGSGTGTGYSSSGYNGYAPSGGSSAGLGSSSGPGSGAACEDLAVCCATLSSLSAEQCTPALNTGDTATCEAFLASIQAAGDCTGTVGVADAGSVAEDAGLASGPCVLGGACSPSASTCTNAGVGPCSSDQRLMCDPSGHFVSNGFPCNAQVPGCGWGSGTCNESCTCTNGLMDCTGNCPDGGLASP